MLVASVNNLGRNIRQGISWLMFGSTGSQLLQFIFGIALARLLVPADFGMIATIQILTGIVGVAASGGMGQSLIRSKNVEEDDFSVVFTIQLLVGVGLCFFILAVAPYFARFFENDLYSKLLIVSAVNFLLRPAAVTRSAWLNRGMRFRELATINLSTSLVSSVASVSMAAAGFGVWSLSVSGLVASLATNVLLYRATPLRLRLRFDRVTARRHASFGANMTVIDAISHLGSSAFNLILSKFGGAAFLGLFNKAESLSRMPNSVITPATSRVVFRALSTVSDDLDKSKYLTFRTITLLTVYVSPFLIGLFWLAEPLILLLYGPKWLEAAEPVRILAIGSFAMLLLRPCSTLLQSQAKLGIEISIACASLAYMLAGCFIAMPWGLRGVAAIIASSHYLSLGLTFLAVTTVIRARWIDLARSLRPALILNTALTLAFVVTDTLLKDVPRAGSALYVGAMCTVGSVVYGGIFLFAPIRELEAEAARWRLWLKFYRR